MPNINSAGPNPKNALRGNQREQNVPRSYQKELADLSIIQHADVRFC